MGELTDALLAAPIGVALLGRLEARHLPVAEPPAGRGRSTVRASTGGVAERHPWPFDVAAGTSPTSVSAAVDEAQRMTLDELLAVAVDVGCRNVGAWTGDADTQLVRAYRDAPQRVAIANAVAEKLAPLRDETVALDRQQWWHTNHRAEGWFGQRRLVNFDHVYGNGEFAWEGVWTCTDPPVPTHDALASAWELDDHPLSRWALPVRADARVFEIRGPEDWIALVESYPKVATSGHSGWELPGPNQYDLDSSLVELSAGRAMRADITRHVLPDWTRIVDDYDGVHLTWLGWLTTEGHVVDLPSGGVTMLRYWFSERTLWLRDVFGEPAPLPGPTIEHAESADVTTDDVRRAQDRAVLRAMLGR